MGPNEQDGHRKPIGTDARVRPVAPKGSIWLKAFYRFLPSVSAFFRRRRMRTLVETLNITPGKRVLDLGERPGDLGAYLGTP